MSLNSSAVQPLANKEISLEALDHTIKLKHRDQNVLNTMNHIVGWEPYTETWKKFNTLWLSL